MTLDENQFYWIRVVTGGNSDPSHPWQPGQYYLGRWYVCGSEVECEPGDVDLVGPMLTRPDEGPTNDQ